MGQRGPKKKTAEPPPLQTPQGVAGKKRTPTSSFDPSAGKDVYEPEKIVATRGAKGVTQFHVKWVGYDAKHNTWEPIENLASCEGMIAEFKEREKTRNAQLEAAAVAKHTEKQKCIKRVLGVHFSNQQPTGRR